MSNLVTVTRHGNIGLVTLNNPPVNALSHAVRTALLGAMKELFATADVRAIVIACEGRTFVAGADIREFGKPPLAPDLPELVEFLDGAPVPTIAAIHGTALGGGLELALACHFRIATGSAKLGLPEVTLGLLPGAGGTQRLPRLIGVLPALELIVSGTPISAAQAERLGLVDEVISEDVKDAALAFAQRVLAEGRAVRRLSALTPKLDDPSAFAAYEQQVSQRFRGYLAPFRCIEAVRAAVQLPFEQGLQRERELFRELMASHESKAQRHVFFGEREVSKVPGLADDTPTRPVKSVAIVGAGNLANALASSFGNARIAVTVVADSQAELDREPLQAADLLLEAVSDDFEAKRATLARLGSIAKPAAILATTSSLLDLDSLADASGRPSDFVGMRFGLPIDRAKLLENARTSRTAPDAYATVMKLGRTLGKVAVPVWGRVGGRLAAQYAREAQLLLHEGASRERVEQALSEFGFRISPFATEDPGGLEAEADVTGRPPGNRTIAAEEIQERCWLALVNDAARLLEQGIAARPLDIDMICVHGGGFPVYRGGPLFYADQLGLEHVYARILRYREQLGAERWTPAVVLQRLALAKGSFYGEP